MSLIGNDKKGFTLVEVLVATAILASGIVSIFQALFIIMTAFSYISHYLDIVPVVDEKVWQVQDEIRRLGPNTAFVPRGEFDAGGKKFDWVLSTQLADSESKLYRIDLSTQWKDGSRNCQLDRSAYVIFESKDEKK